MTTHSTYQPLITTPLHLHSKLCTTPSSPAQIRDATSHPRESMERLPLWVSRTQRYLFIHAYLRQ